MLMWVEAFHIIFMVTWFAGLFYLPRLFVYHADTTDALGHQRFCTMEKRLSVLMSIGAVLTIIFGIWLILLHGGAWFSTQGWLHAKLVLVLALIGYHGWCQMQVRAFRQERNTHGSSLFRMANEIPTVLLLVIVILAVVKPF